jgi:hypothetical protein
MEWRTRTSDAIFFLSLSPIIAHEVHIDFPLLSLSVGAFHVRKRRRGETQQGMEVYFLRCAYGGNAPLNQFSSSPCHYSMHERFGSTPLSSFFRMVPFMLERGEEEGHDRARRCVSSFGCAISFSGAHLEETHLQCIFLLLPVTNHCM